MKAVSYETTGKADAVLRYADIPDPVCKLGEVLVRIRYSGVNPSDTRLRMGLRPGGLPYPRIIPHSDGSGVIVDVGSGVDRQRIGERVWIYNGQWQRAFGTAAEFISIPSEQAVILPSQTSFAAGACLGIPAMTAHFCIHADGGVAGKTLYITGGAGQVGYFAIQMARQAGARVISSASSTEKMQSAAQAGAELVLNYKKDDLVQSIKDFTDGAGVDRIIDVDFAGNLSTTAKIIAENGVIVSYASVSNPQPEIPFYPLMFKNVSIRLALVYLLTPEHRRDAIRTINAMLAEQQLQERQDCRFTLDQTAQAHERIESGNRIGAVLVEVHTQAD